MWNKYNVYHTRFHGKPFNSCGSISQKQEKCQLQGSTRAKVSTKSIDFIHRIPCKQNFMAVCLVDISVLTKVMDQLTVKRLCSPFMQHIYTIKVSLIKVFDPVPVDNFATPQAMWVYTYVMCAILNSHAATSSWPSIHTWMNVNQQPCLNHKVTLWIWKKKT